MKVIGAAVGLLRPEALLLFGDLGLPRGPKIGGGLASPYPLANYEWS
jgi:hypothetical protein